jgi:hypothetical protein
MDELLPNFQVHLTRDEVEQRWARWTPSQRSAYKKFHARGVAVCDDRLQVANFATFKVEVERHGD